MKTTMKTILLVFTSVLLIAGLAFGQGSGAIAPNWYPDDGTRVLVYRAISSGNGTTTLGFSELIGKNFTYDGYFAMVVRDAGATGALPQTELREVTDFSGTTGVITVGTAFTVALAAGDVVVLANRPELHVLFGTFGVPYVTGAEFGAGVSIAEGLADIDDEIDTLHAYVTSTTGAQWGTPAEPAAGVNLFEGLGFLQNQQDSVVGAFYGDVGIQWGAALEPAAGVALDEGVHFLQNQADSIAGALYSDVGAQWGTATEPANGVDLFEGLGFAQNQLDSIVGATYGSVGSQWTETAAEPAAGVAFMQGFHFAQNQLDSIVGAFYGDVGLQWGAAAEPANGVSLDEGVLFLQNQADSIAASLYTTTGAQWGTATEPANGVNLFEGFGFAQNQLDTLEGKLYGGVGSQWAQAAASYAAGVSHEQVLMDLQDQMDTVNTVKLEYAEDMQEGIRDSLEDANDHLQALRGVTTGFVEENVWKTVEIVINFAAAGAWEEAGSTHEFGAVTGEVEFEITGHCSTSVAATSADSIFFLSGDAAGASVWRCLAEDLDAGEGLFRGVEGGLVPIIPTAAQLAGSGGGIWRGTLSMGGDIGFDIDDNDLTGGILVIQIRYRPITTDGSVAAGLGGAL